MATFPYTPGFVHGERIAYAVQINQFQDLTEQRYLRSRQQGLGLVYEFPFPSSALVAGITSFFQSVGGPAITFVAVDHRDASTHTVRFASATLEHLRGPTLQRGISVAFVREQGGTLPVATAYTAPVIADFCDEVTAAASGVVFPEGARSDWFFVHPQITISPVTRWLSLGANGNRFGTANLVEAEDLLPIDVTFRTITANVRALSASSIRLRLCVNSVEQSALSLLASAPGTYVVSGTLTAAFGTRVCIQTSLGSSVGSATLQFAVGYTT